MALLTMDQKQAAYERDKEAIELHKQILVAILGTAQGTELVQGCGWNLDCYKNQVQNTLNDLNNWKNQAAQKIQEAANLAKELSKIKPAIENLGKCLELMPGNEKPLDALIGLGGAFKSKQVPIVGHALPN